MLPRGPSTGEPVACWPSSPRAVHLAAVGDLLAAVEGSPLVRPRSDVAVNVRETRRAYDRATKLPTSLVEALTRTAVLGEQAWGEAKRKNDYPSFRPWLEKLLGLKRQEAACVGYASGNPTTRCWTSSSRG
jgi:carboxypeptidase Taq